MRRPVLVLSVASLTLLLASCGLFVKILGVPTDCEQYVDVLAFGTSDQIVRGTWAGTVQDYPTQGSDAELTVDLTETYVDRDEYSVSGTFALEGKTPATIAGSVSGGCAERYETSGTSSHHETGPSSLSPQSLPPGASLDAEVRGSGGALLWTARSLQPTPIEAGGDTLHVRIDSADANPHHPVARDVALARTAP